MKGFNDISIDRVASTILSLLGVEKEETMAECINEIASFGPLDRVVMYNPDAVAEWVYEYCRDKFAPMERKDTHSIKMLSMVPPVTPVCFASMYSGLLPEKHGIMSYVKPVLNVRTIFDTLSEKGKKVAIVSTAGDSISKIFLERGIDYFIYKRKEQCNEKALSLIDEDKHDLIVLYNGDYDWAMHRFSPTGKRSVRALEEDIATYASLRDRIVEKWHGKRTALAFAPDHGCHRTWGFLGTHGDNVPSDMNIRHFWTILGEEK
ncbi:MAG: alkaline phosphatase family protein [Candidatus Ornithospirochaeta sp.]